MTAFLDGFAAFIAGVRFLTQYPRLIPYVLMPFAITVIFFAATSILAIYYATDLKSWLFPQWDAAVWSFFAYTVVGVILFLGWLFGLVTVGSLIAAPFNDVLSQQVERIMLPEITPPGGNAIRFMQDVGHTLKHETIRLSIYVCLFLISLPLLLIPVAGAVTFAIVMGFINIRYLAWSALDYSMARRRWGFRRKMRWLAERRARTVGYGAAAMAFLSIPFTMLFVLPMIAVGGTVLFCKIVREEDLQDAGY